MTQAREVALQGVRYDRGVGRAVDGAAANTLGGGGGGGGGTVTSVDISGGTTGLTAVGGPITTNGTFTLGGMLAIANGGTGATSASAARTALGLAIGTDVAAFSHTHAASAITDFSEAVDDRVAALLVAGANVTLTYDDGANTLTVAASGGGGSVNSGTTTVDFGAFPGSPHASVAVTGQASILSGSVVRARILPSATADHSADEHIMAASMLDLIVSDITAATGFTVHALARPGLNEPLELPRPDTHRANATVGLNARPPQGVTPSVGGKDTSWLWGQFTIVWEWS